MDLHRWESNTAAPAAATPTATAEATTKSLLDPVFGFVDTDESVSITGSRDTCVDVEGAESGEALAIVASDVVGARVAGVAIVVDGATIAATAVGTLATKYG